MGTKNQNDFSTEEEYGVFLSYLLMSIILTVVCFMHCFRFYSDMFTEERKSVAHRRKMPEKNKMYKAIQWVTMLCILGFYLPLPAFTIMAGIKNACQGITRFGIWSWAAAKTFLFIVYLLRLEQIFGQSSYAYSKKYLLYPLGVFAVVNGILIPSFSWTFFQYNLKDEDAFPNPCIAQFNKALFAWMIGWDFSLNLIFLILFVVPLNRILKANNTASSKNVHQYNNASLKMKYVGIKVGVLTIVATVSTFFAMMSLVLEVAGLTILTFDWIINSICVAWMTAYYPDDMFFGRFCSLCIKCCGGDYQSQASARAAAHEQRTSGTTALSVDTMDQLKASVKNNDTSQDQEDPADAEL